MSLRCFCVELQHYFEYSANQCKFTHWGSIRVFFFEQEVFDISCLSNFSTAYYYLTIDGTQSEAVQRPFKGRGEVEEEIRTATWMLGATLIIWHKCMLTLKDSREGFPWQRWKRYVNTWYATAMELNQSSALTETKARIAVQFLYSSRQTGGRQAEASKKKGWWEMRSELKEWS